MDQFLKQSNFHLANNLQYSNATISISLNGCLSFVYVWMCVCGDVAILNRIILSVSKDPFHN